MEFWEAQFREGLKNNATSRKVAGSIPEVIDFFQFT
jgi:hypothetical protein